MTDTSRSTFVIVFDADLSEEQRNEAAVRVGEAAGAALEELWRRWHAMTGDQEAAQPPTTRFSIEELPGQRPGDDIRRKIEDLLQGQPEGIWVRPLSNPRRR